MTALTNEEVGAFLVRDSATHPGCYVLCVRVPRYENPTLVSHYLVMRTHAGVKLKVACFYILMNRCLHNTNRLHFQHYCESIG